MSSELIKMVDNTPVLYDTAINNIKQIESKIKELKTLQDEYKARLIEEMKAKGLKGLKDETNGITITYVYPTTKETFNTKKFKEENASLYDEYVTFSEVKESIKITIKKAKE